MNYSKYIEKYYFLFLFLHLFLWTLIPSVSNVNLPLDTIEALAWGSDLKWGFVKHPPLSAFAVEIFYNLFGNRDWAYYFLSQLFVITSFYFVYLLSKDILKNKLLAILSVLLLEGIFFYNYTTPEFNVNIAQLPFWSLACFFSWRCIKNDKFFDYVLLGIFIGLGILSKYLFIYLAISIKLLFIYLIYKSKKIRILNVFVAGLVAFIIILPHLIWLSENNFISINYGLQRTGGLGSITDHFYFPIMFALKQIVLLIPFFMMLYFLIDKIKIKKIKINNKLVFLIFACVIPIFLMLSTSFLLGVKIRTMWMTPFYLLIGILFIEIIGDRLNIKKIKKFTFVFILFFLLSPITYLTVSIINDSKRTDYPGKEIAILIENRWYKNFSNDIKIVVGDEWYAGNLSYHLASRPKWVNDLKGKTSNIKSEDGVIYTGNPKVLKKICPGIYGTIKPVGYCMIGKR